MTITTTRRAAGLAGVGALTAAYLGLPRAARAALTQQITVVEVLHVKSRTRSALAAVCKTHQFCRARLLFSRKPTGQYVIDLGRQ